MMGFRSVMISEDYPVPWPDWFVRKYPEYAKAKQPLVISTERKISLLGDFVKDTQKALNEQWNLWPYTLVWLHECGGVTLTKIYPDKIINRWPTEFEESSNWYDIGHSYCYGCSDGER